MLLTAQERGSTSDASTARTFSGMETTLPWARALAGTRTYSAWAPSKVMPKAS